MIYGLSSTKENAENSVAARVYGDAPEVSEQ